MHFLNFTTTFWGIISAVCLISIYEKRTSPFFAATAPNPVENFMVFDWKSELYDSIEGNELKPEEKIASSNDSTISFGTPKLVSALRFDWGIISDTTVTLV